MLAKLPNTVRTLDIIGGEPTLHPEIVPLLTAARSADLRVNLSSNGSNLAVLEAIGRTEPDVTIGVSVNDHETLNAVFEFIKAARPVVKTVYSRRIDPELVRRILELGPKSFYYIYRDATGPAGFSETIAFPDFFPAVSRLGLDPSATVFCSGFLPDIYTYPRPRFCPVPAHVQLRHHARRRCLSLQPAVRQTGIPAWQYSDRSLRTNLEPRCPRFFPHVHWKCLPAQELPASRRLSWRLPGPESAPQWQYRGS